MKHQKSGSRTLLWSVLMSAPGPLVVGLGLLAGRSSTQLADFVRRSAELLAIIMSFVIYQLTAGDGGQNEARKRRLERGANLFVGAMMCLGGAIMLLLALTSEAGDKGNVIPALAIALLGVVANTIFWRTGPPAGPASRLSVSRLTRRTAEYQARLSFLLPSVQILHICIGCVNSP